MTYLHGKSSFNRFFDLREGLAKSDSVIYSSWHLKNMSSNINLQS